MEFIIELNIVQVKYGVELLSDSIVIAVCFVSSRNKFTLLITRALLKFIEWLIN